MNKKVNPNRTVVINGDLSFTNTGRQILQSGRFKKILRQYLAQLEKNRSRKLKAIRPFIKNGEFQEDKFTDFLILLNMKPLSEIMKEGYFDITYSEDEYGNVLVLFLEGLYNYWRNLQRFMVKNEAYVNDSSARTSKGHSLSMNNEALRKLILELYRNLIYNTDHKEPFSSASQR